MYVGRRHVVTSSGTPAWLTPWLRRTISVPRVFGHWRCEYRCFARGSTLQAKSFYFVLEGLVYVLVDEPVGWTEATSHGTLAA
jgi:hypothetical protein